MEKALDAEIGNAIPTEIKPIIIGAAVATIQQQQERYNIEPTFEYSSSPTAQRIANTISEQLFDKNIRITDDQKDKIAKIAEENLKAIAYQPDRQPTDIVARVTQQTAQQIEPLVYNTINQISPTLPAEKVQSLLSRTTRQSIQNYVLSTTPGQTSQDAAQNLATIINERLLEQNAVLDSTQFHQVAAAIQAQINQISPGASITDERIEQITNQTLSQIQPIVTQATTPVSPTTVSPAEIQKTVSDRVNEALKARGQYNLTEAERNLIRARVEDGITNLGSDEADPDKVREVVNGVINYELTARNVNASRLEIDEIARASVPFNSVQEKIDPTELHQTIQTAIDQNVSLYIDQVKTFKEIDDIRRKQVAAAGLPVPPTDFRFSPYEENYQREYIDKGVIAPLTATSISDDNQQYLVKQIKKDIKDNNIEISRDEKQKLRQFENKIKDIQEEIKRKSDEVEQLEQQLSKAKTQEEQDQVQALIRRTRQELRDTSKQVGQERETFLKQNQALINKSVKVRTDVLIENMKGAEELNQWQDPNTQQAFKEYYSVRKQLEKRLEEEKQYNKKAAKEFEEQIAKLDKKFFTEHKGAVDTYYNQLSIEEVEKKQFGLQQSGNITTPSWLNACKSSKLPPPRITTIQSRLCTGRFNSVIALII
jgi:hypothetical protein